MSINDYIQDVRESFNNIEERNKYVIARMIYYLDQICCKYNINYTVACGTLIGVVREQDILYWDSDADIYMDEDSFLMFIEKASSELPKNIILQTNKTDPLFCSNSSFIRLVDLDSEVYPTSLRRVSPNGLHCDIQCVMTDKKKYYQIIKNDNILFFIKKTIQGIFICLAYFLTSFDFKKTFYQLFGYSIYIAFETTFITRHKMLKDIKNDICIYKRYEVMNNEYMKFRDFETKVPSKYDEYLRKWYGDYLKRPDIKEIEKECKTINSCAKFNKKNNVIVKLLYGK